MDSILLLKTHTVVIVRVTMSVKIAACCWHYLMLDRLMMTCLGCNHSSSDVQRWQEIQTLHDISLAIGSIAERNGDC